MTQPTSTNKDNETLAAFAGLIILIVILSILFILTTPDVMSNDAVVDTSDTAEIVDIDDAVLAESVTETATEEVVAIADKVTDEPTVAVEEPTEVVTDESTAVVDESVDDAGDNAGASEGTYDPALVAQGEALFVACGACHGPDGRGIAGLGKDLVEGEFATSASDEEIIAVIINGRPIWDTANTTMVDMPAKGGNPALTNDDVHAIVAYIRSLQSQ